MGPGITATFPYMMIMPQARFLEFLAAEAARYPHFRLVTGAQVDRLIEENGTPTRSGGARA